MLPRRGGLRALVCLLACVQLAATAAHGQRHLWLRADTTDAATTTTAETTKRTASPTATTSTAHTRTTSSSTSTTSSSSSSSSATVTMTSSSTVPTTSATMFNITIVPAGELPLPPVLTPGWGVAGALLLLTGVAYGLVGTRNQAVQVFFSAAFLGALATTVLVLYVMAAPPVRRAVQGAYVVAAAGTGAALGALAVVFRDLAEGLGCLLGGFCLGMWLLCLRAGSLLQTRVTIGDGSEGVVGTQVAGTGTTVFLVAFSVAGYALSWTRWTRPHALTGSTALGGATAAVLGIDAFSRAGLKEFWAYVWHLNDSRSGSRSSLFPLGTTTYPLTRGVRVELAATVLLALAGVVSQLRLWRVVKARRARQAAARADAEQQRALERQHHVATLGFAREAATARARIAWAAAYDARRAQGAIPLPEPPFPAVSSADSGVGSDLGSEKSEKRMLRADEADAKDAKDAAIEMAELQKEKEQVTHHGAITVRVVDDDDSEGGPPTPMVPGPRIVPLPFAVPAGGEGDDDDDGADAKSEAGRSSRAATVAEEEGVDTANVPTATQNDRARGTPAAATAARASLAKRLSHGSAGLLRSLSQRSQKRTSTGTAAADVRGESQEELVSARRADGVDGEEDWDDEMYKGSDRVYSESMAATIDALSSDEEEEEGEEKKGDEEEVEDDNNDKDESPPPVNLTPDRLPRSLSRVALAYRTNEWAKHLSHAEAPDGLEGASDEGDEAGEAAVDEAAGEAADKAAGEAADKATGEAADEAAGETAPDGENTQDEAEETPVPVDVAALQQTPETGAPAPAVRRVVSMAGLAGSRPGSAQLLRASASAPRLSTAGSGGGLRHEPIAEEEETGTIGTGSTGGDDHGSPFSPTSASSSFPPPPVPGVASFTAPQSLLGQREMLLRQAARSSSSSLAGGSLAGGTVAGPDDRARMMRSASLATLTRPASGVGTLSASNLLFNSHQPRRDNGHLPSAATREAQLATFRRSVAAERRGDRLQMRASSASLNQTTPTAAATIDAQRSLLLGQRDAAAARRVQQQRDQARVDRAFEARIRQGGDLLEAHRAALRRMQAEARRQGEE